ncbi:MAG: NAD-dependent epimerase/dehydratase family protein [Caldilineales bacterium]|nr:NAD-dependent epimerase/dehydratase family protein [Caldilineales bacterium]MDW8316945.1 NAD-dependent epimerase/dehydratase family protein [Anaerolineae bacterium]
MSALPSRTLLITGVSGQWGRLLAQRLLGEPSVRLLGIDRRPPDPPLEGLDFIKADVRNPLLPELLAAEGVDTVVHLATVERQWRREADFENNVLGTMQLVGACAEAGVARVVLRSTTALYGARPDNPMYLPEDWPLKATPTYGYLRDALEIEQWLQEFRQEYPELHVAVVRLAHVLGPSLVTPLSRLLTQPVVPCLLGFDPLLQVISDEDAVEALAHAALSYLDGPLNAAAPGAVSLVQAASIAARPLLPVVHWPFLQSLPLLSATRAGRRALSWFPVEPVYLRFPCTADIARLGDVLGWRPQHSAVQAVERFVAAQRTARFRQSPEAQRFADDGLDQALRQRRRRAQTVMDIPVAGLEGDRP